MQACEGGHIESDVQPISTGSPVIWVQIARKIVKTQITLLLTYQVASLISFSSVTRFASAHHNTEG